MDNDGFTDSTLRRTRGTGTGPGGGTGTGSSPYSASAASASLPANPSAFVAPVFVQPVFGLGGTVDPTTARGGGTNSGATTPIPATRSTPESPANYSAQQPATTGYSPPVYRNNNNTAASIGGVSARGSQDSPRPSTSSRYSTKDNEPVPHSAISLQSIVPPMSATRSTTATSGLDLQVPRNTLAKGWGKLKAVVKATSNFVDGSGGKPTASNSSSSSASAQDRPGVERIPTSTSSNSLAQSLALSQAKLFKMPTPKATTAATSAAVAVEEESDDDASPRASEDEEQPGESGTVLLRVYEDAGPIAQRKLFGSKDDVFEGKVEGGENREWKVRYLALTGLDTDRPQLHKLRLSSPSDPTSGLVPVHSWPASALKALKIFSTPRSSFIAVLAPPRKLDMGKLEVGKLAGLVGMAEAEKEYVWVAESDTRRGEFLRQLYTALSAADRRNVKIEGSDANFGLPPSAKTEREKEREKRKEREAERDKENNKRLSQVSLRVDTSAAALNASSAAPAQLNGPGAAVVPVISASSPISARTSSLPPGDYVSPHSLAPRSASLRQGATPSDRATPVTASKAPLFEDDPTESYDLGLLLSAADRLLARQHLLPPALPPDLDLILSSFDFRIGGDARELERRVQDEADALERGNAWALLHVHMDHPAINAAIGRALTELDKVGQEHLEPYSVALVGMGADVRAIEARNRTGGVVADNMSKLLDETRGLLDRLRLPEGLVETLRSVDLSDPASRDRAIRFAEVLWKRMGGPWEGWDAMRCVKDKRAEWAQHAADFSGRIARRVGEEAEWAVNNHLVRFKGEDGSGRKYGPPRVPVPGLGEAMNKYRELISWVREADPRGHYEILGAYVDRVGGVYDREVKRFMGEVRMMIGGKARVYLFSSEPSGAGTITSPTSISMPGNLNLSRTGTAIKDFSSTLTRKTVEGLKDTSGNLLATFKRGGRQLDLGNIVAASSSSTSSPRASSDTEREKPLELEEQFGLPGEDAIDVTMQGVVHPLLKEQAFIADVFEMDGRKDKAGTLKREDGKVGKKDLKWQRRMGETMDRLVPSLLPELLLLLDAAVKRDPTSSLGFLVILEKHQQTVQASNAPSHWILGVMHKAMEKARSTFISFCESQSDIIDETKLLARKRLGTLDFTRTFPLFADRLESLLTLNPNPTADPIPLSRQCVNTAYDLLSRTMFDSLDAISRRVEKQTRLEEDEGRRYGGKVTGAAGEEDAVVVHVLHIQNMHHLNSELRFRKIAALEPIVKRAKALYDYHLAAYTKVVVRRPLGKLLEFFDGVEEMVRNGGEREVAFRQAYSKGVLRELVKKYPGREIKKGLDTLYKRVERNFADDGASSLLQVVWRNIQEDFIRKHALFEELMVRCYPNSGIHLEFTVQDLLAYFSDLARQH